MYNLITGANLNLTQDILKNTTKWNLNEQPTQKAGQKKSENKKQRTNKTQKYNVRLHTIILNVNELNNTLKGRD